MTPGVGQLAAALGVERRAVQHELDVAALAAPRATASPATTPSTVDVACARVSS